MQDTAKKTISTSKNRRSSCRITTSKASFKMGAANSERSYRHFGGLSSTIRKTEVTLTKPPPDATAALCLNFHNAVLEFNFEETGG